MVLHPRMLAPIQMIVCGSLLLICMRVSTPWILAENTTYRTLSGVIVTQKNEAVEGVSVIVSFPSGETETVSDVDGNFRLRVPKEALNIKDRRKEYCVPGKTDRDS